MLVLDRGRFEFENKTYRSLSAIANVEQRRVVERIEEVVALRRHVAETAAETEALLGSILDGAFKGEL